MSKRERSWRDSRKTKKQKTTHVFQKSGSSFHSFVIQILPKLIQDKQGSSSRDLTEILTTRVKRGEWKSTKLPKDPFSAVKTVLVKLYRRGTIQRSKKTSGGHGYLYYNLDGVDDDSSRSSSYSPSDYSSEDEGDENVNNTLWRLAREIIRERPGVTSGDILEELLGRISDGEFSLREGKNDRETLHPALCNMLTRRVNSTSVNLTRKGIGSHKAHPFRYYLDHDEDVVQLSSSGEEEDVVVGGVVRPLWDYTKEIIENNPGVTSGGITDKLMEKVQNGEFSVSDFSSSVKNSDRENLQTSVCRLLMNYVKTNLHGLTRKGKGNTDPYRYYINQDECAVVEVDEDETQSEDVAFEEEKTVDERESMPLDKIIVEILEENSEKTVKEIADHIVDLIASGKLENHEIPSKATTSYFGLLRAVADEVDEMLTEGKLERTGENDNASLGTPFKYSVMKEEDEDDEIDGIVVDEASGEESLFREKLDLEFSDVIEIISRADSESEKREYRDQFLENVQKWKEDLHEKITGNTVFELY